MRRLAIAVDRWMLAFDRRTVRKAALIAKTPKEGEHALAVLERLHQAQASAPSRRSASGAAGTDE